MIKWITPAQQVNNGKRKREIAITSLPDSNLKKLVKTHKEIRNPIKKRLKEFSQKRDISDKELFAELAFCICTPMSKAVSCDEAVRRMKESGVLYSGSAGDLRKYMRKVRFYKNKSDYIMNARKLFSENGRLKIKDKIHDSGPAGTRGWFAENVPGIGYKEASHFLRNIGLGKDLAILYVHILRNLRKLGVIKEIPKSISKKAYLKLEKKMKGFSRETGIPMIELDLLLWYNGTGMIFK